jgi:hypothetical protein
MGWAAVEWLNNGDGAMYGNWGQLPGIAAPVGATNVSFWAKADTDNVEVKFSAGGIMSNPTATVPIYCGDTDSASLLTVTLTPTWTEYKILLSHTTTADDIIVGAFNWAIANTQDAGAGSAGPYNFEVSNVEWTQ